MLKNLIKAKPTSREMYSVGINTYVGPVPLASLQDLHSGLGPTLVLIYIFNSCTLDVLQIKSVRK